MGYWTAEDLPFYYGLARTFPIGDRYFASCLAQTFPNRRFLQAGTASGLVATRLPNPFEPNPLTGIVWDELDQHHISWVNYFVELPEIGLYPRVWIDHPRNARPIVEFYQDCRAGRLPAVSLLTPDLFVISEGETQDVQAGEAFTAWFVDAVLRSPAWPHTMLIVVYDEGGGYYDHVPPPPRPLYPTTFPRRPTSHPINPEATTGLGFRVPCIVVAPFAKAGHVSHVIYDHTSILKTIQHKWNLPPLTRRDAAAADMLDFLDLTGPPAFLQPPPLPPPRCTYPDRHNQNRTGATATTGDPTPTPHRPSKAWRGPTPQPTVAATVAQADPVPISDSVHVPEGQVELGHDRRACSPSVGLSRAARCEHGGRMAKIVDRVVVFIQENHTTDDCRTTRGWPRPGRSARTTAPGSARTPPRTTC